MSDPEASFADRVQTATVLQGQRRWAEAGGAWVEAARVAVDAGDRASARKVLGLAGEAFRRDDQVGEATRALRLSLSFGPDPVEAVALQVSLAGLCAELGRWAEGIDRCRRARDAAPPPLRPVALDTLAGLYLGYRSKELARPLVRELADLGGDAAVAAGFRRSQLARMDGDLPAARRAAEEVIGLLAGRAHAEAGLAAARAELAEVDLLEGRPLPALVACEEARREHEAAGRRGLAWRAEAARARAALEAGLEVFPGPLRQGAAFAEERGLVILALDLRIATGAALRRRDPAEARHQLERAIREAETLGARLHAGRARLWLAPVLPPEERRAAWESAAADLEEHVPLRELALRGVAEPA